MKNVFISLLICGFVFSIHHPIRSQNSQKLFQQGLIQEEGEGDLPKAIEIYNSLVVDVSVDRNLRAKALLQIGTCYEKLGNQNARKTYQKLISEYADQEDIVAIGRQKLKGLNRLDPNSNKKGIVVSQVLFPEQNAGGVSPDGRYLIYVDWTTEDNKPAINIKDLQSGSRRRVSKVGTWESPINFPDNPIWSPDGKQFAYFWHSDEIDGCELHISNTDGTDDIVVAKGSETPYPYAWSPDGKFIACTLAEQIALFSVNDGSLKFLTSLEGLKLDKMKFSPDNKYIVYSLQQMQGSHENDIHLISIDGRVNKKIISDPANDFDPLWSPDAKNILFISDRHGTNDLWKIRIDNENSVGIAELVTATLGKRGTPTQLLGLSNDQSLYYETSSSRSDIHLANIDFSSTTIINSTTRISNLNVTENTNPAISKDGRYIAFVRWQLFQDEGLGRPFVLTIYDTKTGEIKDTNTLTYILSQLYWYWPKPQWSPDGKKLLYHGRQKEKENLISGVFTYDIESENTTPINLIPNYTKYTEIPSTGSYHVFSNDGKSIYYLSANGKNIRKIEFESKDETVVYTNSDPISFFKLSNDESKIVYVPSNDWSELYLVATSGGISKKIVSLKTNNSLNLIGWESNDTHFYFGVGKTHLDVNSILRVSIEGGTPELILNLKDTFPDGAIREIVIDHSNRTMAIQVNVENVEMWKLEGIFNE